MERALSSRNDKSRLQRLAGVTLRDGEEILAVCRIHGAIFWKSVAVLLVAIFFLIVAFNLGVFLLIVAAIMFGIEFLTRHFLILAATNRRVLVRSGILYQDVIDLRYHQIETVELGAGPFAQMFGFANVIITGTGQRRMIVPYIADPMEFRDKVNGILLAEEE